MRYPTTPKSLFSVLGLCIAAASAGCAPVEDADDPNTSVEAVVAACPEAVTTPARGEPRNAAGHIRYCWPGMAHCYCDRDNDCYAQTGYVACAPVTTAARDAGVADTGVRDTGVRDTGVRDTGVRDAGPADTGVRDSGPVDTGVRDAGPADTGSSSSTSGTASTSVPTLGGCNIFPANNAWNQDISGLAVHPNSANIIANIQANGETTVKADFGHDTQYGIPITVAPIGQPFLPVRFTEYGDESDVGPYPAPTTATIEGGNDHHVLVLHQGACLIYEMYHASRSGTGWAAGSGAVFDLSTNALRPNGWTSTDQAGLPILPGLTRFDEVNAGAINHALRVTFNHTRAAWIAPATHPGGASDVNAPPMGLRLRLKASYDISRFTGQTRVILTALKRYGMFVADTGSNWYISGASDSRWNDTDLQQLTGIPGTAFEAVNTGAIQTQ